MPTLNLPHQNRLCIGTKPAFSFWINISTVSEVRCDCQGLGLVARIEASILVFDTQQVLHWPVLGQIHFCSFDRRCKTCLYAKPVLYQSRFGSLTIVHQADTVVFPRNWQFVCTSRTLCQTGMQVVNRVISCSMMTSSNGNIFRVTGPLCEEFTGHRWIPAQRPMPAAELWCFLWYASEQKVK